MIFLDLSTIDENIKNCKKLSILNLSANPISIFPIPLTQVLSLEELCLNDTQLEFIPANIGRLINLRVLELRDNKISQIPKAVSHLMQLYRLDIGQNDFIDFVSINKDILLSSKLIAIPLFKFFIFLAYCNK